MGLSLVFKTDTILQEEESYMYRALELARKGMGCVSPNPLVGCVIVHQDKIIGEGWHQQYGEAHAEVNAVQSVKDKSLIKESTVYVSLEPCSHFGKTPPCVDLLIHHQPRKVIICNTDTNPLVAGTGIKKLNQAGIEVKTGILEKEGRDLNKRFFTFMEKKRPYIILKWAETADGFIARENWDSKWISNTISRKLVHQWRTQEDAVMVGANTAQQDNPKLNVRDWTGRNPQRIVIDRNLRLAKEFFLFDQSQMTFCYNTVKNEEKENLNYIKVSEENLLEEIFADLYKRKVQSVIVEGGSWLINQLLENKIWDEARVFTGEQIFLQGIKAPQFKSTVIERCEILEDIYEKTMNINH